MRSGKIWKAFSFHSSTRFYSPLTPTTFLEVTRMKLSLRSSAAAAAMLLAPLGAMLVAQPAAAQHQYVLAPSAAPIPAVIERVVVRGGSFQTGSDVHFRLVGTPGGRAWVQVPGLIPGLAMEETRPGVYEAHWTIRAHDYPAAFSRTVGVLQFGNERSTAQAEVHGLGDGRRWAQRRDDIAPQISDLTPSQGDRVSDRGLTRITARVSDEGSGVDRIALRIDGRDVSNRVGIDGSEVRYVEDLQPGRHTAEIQVSDRAGNVSRRSWSFAVVDRDHRGRGYGYGYGR
jgi:hypothetical protein